MCEVSSFGADGNFVFLWIITVNVFWVYTELTKLKSMSLMIGLCMWRLFSFSNIFEIDKKETLKEVNT